MSSQTFSVTDYKGVREITLQPSGRLVVIAGGNGAGKSSFIDAVTELFDPKGTKLTPVPIRVGADEARAEYIDEDLDLKITRRWTKNGTAGTLTVETLDGAKYSRPADVVASLLGGAIFDPVAFLNLPEKAQRDALLAKVTLPFDLDALNRNKAGAEQRRLEAGREVKRLHGALESLPKPAAGLPSEEVSAQEILDEIEKAQTFEQQRSAANRRHDEAARRFDELQAEIERLTALRELAAEHQVAAKFDLDVLPAPVDIAPLRERLADVENVNAQIRAARQYLSVSGELQVADLEHETAQAHLDGIAATKAEGLAAATFPVDGLSVDDEGVTFDGVPFGQVNSAMRLRVAFAIATAGDPKVKLVIIKSGDLLDALSLEAIANIADDRGFTVLVERDRDESRQIGFTIRDGALSEDVS